MAVSRRCLDGTTQEDEPLNKSQVYVTTAGYKGTFPYEKLISLLLRSVTQPDKAIILGGTWRLPVAVGLQSRNFIRDQRDEGTYNEASFGREYESSWSGTAENGFFDGEAFDKQRIIPLAEYEASGKRGENSYYVLAVDVGRFGCQSVVSVIKVNPRTQGDSIKRLVNIVTMNDEHFEAQAIKLKRLFYAYKARRIIIDGNGLGAGLLDFMTRSQIDELGQSYPDFGVYGGTNPASVEQYKKQHTEETEEGAMYIIKANLPINTAAHTNLQSQVATGHIKFLIEPAMAKIKLLGTKKGQLMSPEQRNEYLLPFTLTSILKEEMLNLREENAGVNIILKSVNKRLGHDKVSSLEYGLYYIKEEEETKKKKKTGRFKDYMFMS